MGGNGPDEVEMIRKCAIAKRLDIGGRLADKLVEKIAPASHSRGLPLYRLSDVQDALRVFLGGLKLAVPDGVEIDTTRNLLKLIERGSETFSKWIKTGKLKPVARCRNSHGFLYSIADAKRVSAENPSQNIGVLNGSVEIIRGKKKRPLDPNPTHTMPGPDRVAVYEERAAKRYAIFHPLDRKGDESIDQWRERVKKATKGADK